MADVQLTVQDAARSGTVVVYNTSTTVPPLTATDRFQIPNNGTVQILVKNGATGTLVTIETPSTVDGLAVADREVTVAADTDVIIGPFPPSIYNDSDGNLNVSIDDVSHVSLAAVRSN